MDLTLSSWSCRYEADGLCRKLDGAFCRPGMKGCILVGKVTFQDGVVPSPVWPAGDREASGESQAGSTRPERKGTRRT
jgi:hypothetical protein